MQRCTSCIISRYEFFICRTLAALLDVCECVRVAQESHTGKKRELFYHHSESLLEWEFEYEVRFSFSESRKIEN